MRAACNSSKNRQAALPAALLAVAIAGCAALPVPNVLPDEIVSLKRTSETRLINEGGPVFAMPGEVKIPGYMGRKDDVQVTGERLNGSAVLGISSANADADGVFELRVPANAGLFFATSVITHDDTLHRIRTLVRPEDGRSIRIDAAATLVASKVMLASKRHKMAELGALYDQTAELTTFLRENVPAEDLGLIWLDRPNQELAMALDGLAMRLPELQTRLRAWEQALYSDSLPAAAGTGPAATGAIGLPALGPPPK